MKIKELIKGDKTGKAGIYILLLLGVILLAFGSVPKKEKTPAPGESSGEDYFSSLENRLEEILSRIDGAGEVEILLVGENRGSISVEKDGSGESSKTVVLSGQNGSEPLILEENSPGVRGAVIVAQGGGDDRVKAELAQAAATALGVGLHRVGVYKMSGRGK